MYLIFQDESALWNAPSYEKLVAYATPKLSIYEIC